MSFISEFPYFGGEFTDKDRETVRARLREMPDDATIAKGLLVRYCGGFNVDAKYPATKEEPQEFVVLERLLKDGLLVRTPKQGLGTTREGLRVLAGERALSSDNETAYKNAICRVRQVLQAMAHRIQQMREAAATPPLFFADEGRKANTQAVAELEKSRKEALDALDCVGFCQPSSDPPQPKFQPDEVAAGC